MNDKQYNELFLKMFDSESQYSQLENIEDSYTERTKVDKNSSETNNFYWMSDRPIDVWS